MKAGFDIEKCRFYSLSFLPFVKINEQLIAMLRRIQFQFTRIQNLIFQSCQSQMLYPKTAQIALLSMLELTYQPKITYTQMSSGTGFDMTKQWQVTMTMTALVIWKDKTVKIDIRNRDTMFVDSLFLEHNNKSFVTYKYDNDNICHCRVTRQDNDNRE